VVIDFWATWCGPCLAELPNVKQAYKDFHGKGMEIVGVSCDSDENALNSFTRENEMPWVQLRESSQVDDEHKWNPIATRFSVTGIPRMFIVDKKGILRDVDAQDNLGDKVKKLLAESDAPAPK
jgi:thiol-disulfide isomerase/thioredoxin